MAADDPVAVRVDPESLRKLLADVKAFDAGLARALRVRLRAAGADAVAEIRRTVREDTPGGTPLRTGGIREEIADGTRVSIVAGKRMQGVRIVSTSTKITAAHKAMLKAYNKRTWRRPDRAGKFVTQQGRPYFGSVLDSRKLEMRLAVEDALIDARNLISRP